MINYITIKQSIFNRVIKKSVLYLFTLLSLLTAYLGFVEENEYLSFYGLIILCITVFFCNEFDCFAIILFLMPNARICRIYGYTYHTFFLLLFIIKSIINLFSSEKKFVITNAVLKLCISSLLVLISIGVTNFINFEYSSFVSSCTFMLNIVFFVLLLQKKITINELKYFCQALIAGCVVSLLLLLIYNNFFLELGIERYAAIGDDPNYTAALMILGITSLLTMIYLDGKHLVARFVECIILIFYGLITQSRGFLVSCVFVILLYICFIIKSNLSFEKKVAVLICSAIICIFMIAVKFDIVWRAVSRFFSVEDISSGRLFLWEQALREWLQPENFLFGCGELYIYLESNGFPTVQHNSYIELLTNFGVFGLLFYILMLLSLFNILKNKFLIKKINFIFFIILCPFLCVFFFLNGIFTDGYINGLLLLLLLVVFVNNKFNYQIFVKKSYKNEDSILQ